MNKIVLGTRGSDLALAQARMVADALRESGFSGEIEERIISTSGDRRQDIRLSDFAKGADPVVEMGVFTKELEDALLAGEIDAAVHSLKDLPSRLAEEFGIAAVLPRAAVEDVLLLRGDGCSLAELPAGAKVATSSVRRARMVAWRRPDVELIDIRGNVPTRLRKLADGRAGDATLLARAGLQRLGFYRDGAAAVEIDGVALGCHLLADDDFIPAAGQGAVGIETLAGSPATAVLAAIDDLESARRVAAERAFLFRLGAGCDTPVGVHARLVGTEMELEAVVFDEADASAPPKTGLVRGAPDDAEALAAHLFEHLKILPNNDA